MLDLHSEATIKDGPSAGRRVKLVSRPWPVPPRDPERAVSVEHHRAVMVLPIGCPHPLPSYPIHLDRLEETA